MSCSIEQSTLVSVACFQILLLHWKVWFSWALPTSPHSVEHVVHCVECTLCTLCTAQCKVHFGFLPGPCKIPPTRILGLPQAPAMPKPPNLHTLTFSLSAQYRPTFVNSKTMLFSENLTIFNKNQHFCEPILATSLKRLLNLHKPVTCPINYAKSRLFGKM